MSRTGQIWNYFSVSDENNKKAECNFCKKIFSYKSTSSNLKYHLRLKHIIVHEELCRSQNRQSSITPRIEDNDSEKSDKLESDEVIMKVDESTGATFEYVEGLPEEADATLKNDEEKAKDETFTEYDVLDESEFKTETRRPRRRRYVNNVDEAGWETNIDSFSTYIASILKMLPRQTVARFQVLIVQRLVKEQMKYV